MAEQATALAFLAQVATAAAGAGLPPELRTVGIWGAVALVVAIMLVSLALAAFQSTARFLLKTLWPGLLLLALQAAGILPAPPVVAWPAPEEVILEEAPPSPASWWPWA